MHREWFYPPKLHKSAPSYVDHDRENLTTPKSVVGARPGPESSVGMADPRQNVGGTRFRNYHDVVNSSEEADFGRNAYLGKTSKRDFEEVTLCSRTDFEDFGTQHTWPGESLGGSREWMDKILGDTFKKGYLDRNSFRVSIDKFPLTAFFVSSQFARNGSTTFADRIGRSFDDFPCLEILTDARYIFFRNYMYIVRRLYKYPINRKYIILYLIPRKYIMCIHSSNTLLINYKCN